LDSPYFRLDDTVRNLTYPVLFRKGRSLPAGPDFYPFLNIMRPEQIAWDTERNAIRLDSEWFNITDLNFSAKANGLLIELFVTEPIQYENLYYRRKLAEYLYPQGARQPPPGAGPPRPPLPL